MRSRTPYLVVAVLTASLLVTACSSDSSSSTPVSPDASSTAYCQDVQQVKDSYDALVGTNVIQDGTDALKANFQTFKDDLDALGQSAGDRFSSEVSAVQSSLDQIGNAIDSGGSAAEVATGIASGLSSLKTSWEALVTAVDQACAGS